jgi:hypothetical protein
MSKAMSMVNDVCHGDHDTIDPQLTSEGTEAAHTFVVKLVRGYKLVLAFNPHQLAQTPSYSSRVPFLFDHSLAIPFSHMLFFLGFPIHI